MSKMNPPNNLQWSRRRFYITHKCIRGEILCIEGCFFIWLMYTILDSLLCSKPRPCWTARDGFLANGRQDNVLYFSRRDIPSLAMWRWWLRTRSEGKGSWYLWIDFQPVFQPINCLRGYWFRKMTIESGCQEGSFILSNSFLKHQKWDIMSTFHTIKHLKARH